jgi:glycosyltransferase involved in cell wall biosynthesis
MLDYNFSNMKIGMIVTNAYRPDPRVQKEARSLVGAGHQVRVVCWDRKRELPPEAQDGGISIHRLGIQSTYAAGSKQMLYLPRFLAAAFKNLEDWGPQVVHCHDLDTTLAGYVYSRKHHVPWIFDAHEHYPEQMHAQVHRSIYYILVWLERRMVRAAKRVITASQVLAELFQSYGAQVTVLPNCSDLELYQDAAPGAGRESLGLSEHAFIVAYIGGFTRARALLPLIQATELNQEVEVVLVGDGIQRSLVESMLPDHPRVHYLGWVPQEAVPAYIHLADVIYYGLNRQDRSAEYNNPNALFNAMAAGKPFLTTNGGDVARIVRDQGCGIVVEQATPDLLAEAMRRLSDRSLRLEMGRRARQAALTQYNWGVMGEKLIDLYSQLG